MIVVVRRKKEKKKKNILTDFDCECHCSKLTVVLIAEIISSKRDDEIKYYHYSRLTVTLIVEERIIIARCYKTSVVSDQYKMRIRLVIVLRLLGLYI